MSLPSGAPFGPYRIVAKLGEGGMGEVYRAHDPALGREVAIKIIAAPLAAGEDGQARFQREARVLAALNHPHIASVFGLVEEGSVRGLVMELVEGPTLDERLASGALPLNEAIARAHEIAEALEAAHDKGIIHRDLKPANLKLTRGGIKVLDFGIAKVLSGGDSDVANATTMERTREGTVVGTAAYMSPEQARGELVDARTDIWAFGCVLFEMLAGRRAFEGRTSADTLAHILKTDPDWPQAIRTAPPAIARLIRRCLEKDPARRLRSIADARFEIEDVSAAPAAARVAPTFWTRGIAAGALVAVAVIGFALYTLTRKAASTSGVPSATPMVLGMLYPPGETLYQFVDPLKISPDGTRLAMITLSSVGKSRLWLRSLDQMAPEPVPEAAGATFPFWSPNSRSLGFCADGQLKIMDLASRSVRPLAPSAGSLCGASWNRDDQLVVVRPEGLGLIRASGGELKSLTTVDRSQGEFSHAFPNFLPDGRHFIFIVLSVQPGRHRVAIGSIDSSEITPLADFSTMPVYADGYLFFTRGSELMAQRFDAASRVLTGDPVAIPGGLLIWTSSGARGLSVSETGALVFMTRRVVTTQLTWFDRSGRPAGTLGEPAEWVHVAISPDERTVAAEGLDARNIRGTIWTIDIARNLMSSFTLKDNWGFAPVWSHDGRRIAFASAGSASATVFAKAIDGSGGDEPLYAGPGLNVPTDFRADRLLMTRGGANIGGVFSVVPGSDRPATPVVPGASGGVTSPDGRWMAYVSAESGRMEIYVRAVTGERPTQISRAGGSEPRWRRDGKELFFVSADRKLAAVAVTTGQTFSAGEPQMLPIDTQPDAMGNRYTYDVAALGTRFLVGRPAGVDPTPPIAVLLNWQALLKK